LIAEHGVDGARRWLRRELLRSTPRMLAQRARGGAHPVRRAQLAGCMLTLAVSETWLLDRPTTGPVSSIFAWAVVILFACAVVVRAATFIQGSWMSASFLEYVLVHVEGVQSPFLVTSSLIAAIGIALTLHMPWNVATWRFLTTWGGGAEDEPRRPRAS
jgi:hypothetical protein